VISLSRSFESLDILLAICVVIVFFFKQKTAYEIVM